MPKRIRVNTEDLQEKFPGIYKELYSRCSIVTSVPGVFYWSGEYAVNFGGPAVTQKLPIRVYTGIEPLNSKGTVEFGDMTKYVSSKNAFEKYKLEKSEIKEKEEFLKKAVIRLTGNSDFQSFRIHAVFEVPTLCGFCSSSNFSTAIMAAILVYIKKYEAKEYEKYIGKSVFELSQDKEFFGEIFHECCKFSSTFYNGAVAGSILFSSMADSIYPIVYFTEKRRWFDGEKKDNGVVPHTVIGEKDIALLDKLKIWAFDTKELFNLKNNPPWPIDFGLVYTGNIKMSGRVTRMIRSIENYIGDIEEYVSENFNDVEKSKNTPFFYNPEKNGGQDFWYNYLMTLSMLSFDVSKNLSKLFHSSSNESYDSFFRSINLYSEMVNLIDPVSKDNKEVCYSLKDELDKINTTNETAIKINDAGRGGDILFALPYGIAREKIGNIIKSLAEKTGKGVNLDYASWIDGYGEEGLRFDQVLEEGIYSKFISKGGMIINHIDTKKNTRNDIYTTIDRFEKDKKKMDLIMDPTANDVYVGGEKLSSKEIHSVRTTIEILEILIDNFGKEVVNEKLPRSSYSTNRNELQSKIIIPLQKILKSKLNKNISIEIHGSLDNFYVSLKSCDCDIYILKKLF